MSAAHEAKAAGEAALAKVKQTARHPWVEACMRLGYAVRGLVYLIIGALALQLAAGEGGAASNPSSAIALLGRQPWGKWLLVVVAIGLAGYALWGVVRAVFDPLRRGHDAKGWLERGGFLLSAFSYILLLIPTVASILNLRQSASAGGAAVPPAVRQSPWAPWLFGAFGLFWLVNGAAQLLAAYRASFVRDLEVGRLQPDARSAVVWSGRIGTAARGLVFGLVGFGILRTVLRGSEQAPGMDAALAGLIQQPYGPYLLGLVALGLVLFGVYSIACAWWAKVGAD